MNAFGLLVEPTDELGLFMREVLMKHLDYTVRLPRPDLFTTAFDAAYEARCVEQRSKSECGDWLEDLMLLLAVVMASHPDQIPTLHNNQQQAGVPQLRRGLGHDERGVVGAHLLQDVPGPGHAQGGHRRRVCGRLRGALLRRARLGLGLGARGGRAAGAWAIGGWGDLGSGSGHP